MEKEQRRRTRVPVNFEAVISSGSRQVPVETYNMSLKGMFCTSGEWFEPGLECTITLKVAPDINIVIRGRIIRNEPNGTAVDFLDIETDHFCHLKKIIEYNSGDPEKIDRELLKPVFTHPS